MPSFIGWVPTSTDDVEGFFELAPVSTSDVVYDLGSGDGRLLFAAIEKGAGKAIGIDLDAGLVKAANEAAKQKGIQDRISFLEGDVLESDLKKATLVFCYLYPTASEALKPKIEAELKPGTRVVMESFYFHGWKENKTIQRGGKSFFLYIMPPQQDDIF
jgi:ribosomal protein L11 methylase PrmA